MIQNITLNGTLFEITPTTGKVLSTDKNLETKVSGGGGGGFSRRGSGYTAPVRVTSTTTVHDQFFIEDNSGKEHSFQLSGFDLACREGNRLTVLSAAKTGKTGYYFEVINHATDKVYYNRTSLEQLCGPNKYVLFFLVIVSTFLGFEFSTAAGVTIMVFAVITALFYYTLTLNANIKKLKGAINPSSYN